MKIKYDVFLDKLREYDNEINFSYRIVKNDILIREEEQMLVNHKIDIENVLIIEGELVIFD